MRMSALFSQTLREKPSDAEIRSHELLVRAGFINQLAAGIFTLLPLGQRSIDKIEDIMREEINAIGGQEVTMPVVHPADVWKETERWYQIGSEMGRMKDRTGRDMVLAMTHEEVVADLVRKTIRSYRQLPSLIYHIQTKWRDDPRPRAGLIRVREFTMKDSYSLDSDWEGLDQQYRDHYQAYFNIFHRCGLSVEAVKSDVGMMGGKMAHEFMYLTPVGEDTLLFCDECRYAANRQIARFQKPKVKKEKPLETEKVATPDIKTIEGLAGFLEIPEAKTAKAVFMVAIVTEGTEDRDQFIFALVRGDMELNETKLANAVQAKELRPATDDEIKAHNAVPGYASPMGVKNAMIIVDDLVPESANLVAGANEEGFHLRNVNYGRDYEADLVTDLAAAEEGSPCPECGHPMHTIRGVEVGNIFKLGTRYSDSMGCTFLDKDGEEKSVIMGSYGIGSGRLLASVAEEFNDENGLIWPISITPYQVHLVALSGAEDEAEAVNTKLQEAGFEILFDDRDETPGVKFADADLLGMPIRLTVSKRSLKSGGVEHKLRSEKDGQVVAIDQLVETVQAHIKNLEGEIADRVLEMPFEE